MKKLAIIIMAALLALVICAAALAGDQNARDLYDSAAKLLFWTNNATVNVTADFSLDGEWFKTAEVTLKQDQNRSLHRLFLRSPKADGTERKNGYTVVINDEKLFLMEVFTPGVYRSGTTTERDSILRRSAESGLMLQLGYALAGQADTLLGSGALTKEADGSYSLKLSGEIPLIVDAAAGQFFRFAAKRYFDVDFDRIDANDYVKMNSYTTTSARGGHRRLLYQHEGRRRPPAGHHFQGGRFRRRQHGPEEVRSRGLQRGPRGGRRDLLFGIRRGGL